VPLGNAIDAADYIPFKQRWRPEGISLSSDGPRGSGYSGVAAFRIVPRVRGKPGTLCLDEFGELPLELQPKLLRVMQERQFERLGGEAAIHTDVRVICATHQSLVEMINERQFRADLFYRLGVFPIELPPLRDRPEDTSLLVHHFAIDYAARMHNELRLFQRNS
jgi:DNA-binding NtrC family response regulator